MTIGLSVTNDAASLVAGDVTITGGTLVTSSSKIGMFSPYGHITTEITSIAATMTIQIDFPSTVIRDAIALWNSATTGDVEMRIINSAGPTTIQTWTMGNPLIVAVPGTSLNGTWRRMPGTAFDRIEIDYTPDITKPVDPDPFVVFRLHVASDVSEIRSEVSPLTRQQASRSVIAQSRSQRRGRPLTWENNHRGTQNHAEFADITKMLEIWRRSEYGGIPMIYLAEYDKEDGSGDEGKGAESALLGAVNFTPISSGADSWTLGAGYRGVPHDKYPLGPDAVFE